MAFGPILQIIGLAAKAADNVDVARLANDLKNTQSISERARKSIFVYPVLFSSGMSDLDVDMDVAKFLEIQYGIFTLLTVGMTPNVENGSIDNYLKSISAESVDGLTCTLKSYDPKQVKTWYDMFSEENKDFFEEYKYSLEAVTRNPKGNNKNNNDNQITINLNTGDKDKNKNSDVYDPDASAFDPFAPSPGTATVNLGSIEKKLSDAAPTMLELSLKIKGYQDSFKVPICLKANPHFLRSDELGALFDSAIEDKRLLTRIVKLTSGEISFFKDFIFNLDRIKRDQKLYESFGQHPWYQQFMARKEKNRAKRLSLIISSLLGGQFKEVISSTSNYLPTASIVLNVDELERSTKMKFGFLMKNEKILWSVLNHLGLLCIGIYEPRTDTFTFYFNGFKKPLVMRRKDMTKSSGKSDQDKMVDMMNLMLKRGIM